MKKLLDFIIKYKNIILLMFIYCIIEQKIENFKCNFTFILILLSVILIDNIIFNFVRSNRICHTNEKILSNASSTNIIEEYVISVRDKLYTLHSISMQCNKNSIYYDFYLNKFYELYYQINMDNVYIKIGDVYYV